MKTVGTITCLLQEYRGGRHEAIDELYALVYDELRGIAEHRLVGSKGRLLDATALVHAAYARLLGKAELEAADRRQFYFLLSRAMRDVLVEQVRAARSLKRGGGRQPVPMVEVDSSTGKTLVDVTDVSEALDDLAQQDETASLVVRLRFFCGMTLQETAEAIGITFAVTRRHWDYARAWLHERLADSGGSAQ
jgi:RNA polymerase sigma factor (TIGR02999 family)